MQDVTLKRLLALALPAAASVLLTNAFKMIDQYSVQWLGVNAQAVVGVLEGAGDTRTVFYWSTPTNLLRIPLGWPFSIPLGYGSAGVRWVINLTTLCKAVELWGAVVGGRSGFECVRGVFGTRIKGGIDWAHLKFYHQCNE